MNKYCVALAYISVIGGIIMVGIGGSITNNMGSKICPDDYVLCSDSLCVNPAKAYPLGDIYLPSFRPELYITIACGDKIFIIRPSDTLSYMLIPAPNDKTIGYILVGVGLGCWFIVPCIFIRIGQCIEEKANLPRNLRRNSVQICPYCMEEMNILGNISNFACGHSLHKECYTAYKNSGIIRNCPLCRQNLVEV